MSPPTSWTFYGFVEDPFANDFISVDPAAFGYVPGQKITGNLALVGETANTWLNSPEDARFLSMAEGLAEQQDFFFQQAATGNWTEADFSSPLSLGSTDDERPLIDMRATLFHSSDPDGPTLRLDQVDFGGAYLTNDDSLTAIVSGAWVPVGVTPNLVYGTREADVLRPSQALNLVWGGRGEDDIRVRSGEAFVWGGEGDDFIRGNAGRDFVWGGIGDDQIFGQGADDLIRGEWGDDVLEGGGGNDVVYGGPGFDFIRGGDGHDILFAGGGGGTDIVLGGAGDDFIASGSGHVDESGELERSVSSGGPGDDIILASFDAILTGGRGADIFALGDGTLSSDNLGGLDITDFSPGVDLIGIQAGERYDTFEEIIGAATQQGSDVVFDFFPETIKELPSLVLEEVWLNQLTTGSFFFGDIP